MTKVDFLQQLKKATEEAVKEVLLPVRYQVQDKEEPEDRAAAVYLTRLPDAKSATKMAPYILHQVLTAKDEQPEGQHQQGSVTIRSIFCVYHSDEQLGGLALLTLMERFRVYLLGRPVLACRYELDLGEGVEYLIYNNDTAPYFAGEMVSTWSVPPAEIQVRPWLRGN